LILGFNLSLYILTIVFILYAQGQIYERKAVEKYLEKEGDAAVSPVTRERFKSKKLVPLVHVRNAIEHLIESGIVEGELADTWKERVAEKKRSEEELKRTKEGAENGNAEAMYDLGEMYKAGQNGLKKDWKEAYKWYKKAADAGNVMGTASVAACLLYGFWGVEKNQSEGLLMVMSAAKDGSDYACFLLGEIYFKGYFGFKVNYASSKQWLEKAVAEGEDSCEHRHLSDGGIEEAKGWIAQCIAFLENT